MQFKYKFVGIVTPTIVLFDQLSKWWILNTLSLGSAISIIPDYLDIVHVRNTGAAFGLFASASDGIRIPFFYIVAGIAAIVLITTLIRLPAHDRGMLWIVALVMGGLVGNLIDRLRLGSVVDFVSFHWQDKWEWPAFNVADSAITIAMILLVVQGLRGEKKHR